VNNPIGWNDKWGPVDLFVNEYTIDKRGLINIFYVDGFIEVAACTVSDRKYVREFVFARIVLRRHRIENESKLDGIKINLNLGL
jgi:hypothetical protein